MLLLPGDIGRLVTVAAVQDGDDFTIQRDGKIFRVNAEALAAYIDVEGITVTPITDTDSPYSVLVSDRIIEATIDATDIDINLLALASVVFDLIIIRNNTGAGSGTLDVIADGSEKIKEPGGVLLGNKTIDGDGDSLSLLGVNSAHYNIV